MVNSRLSYLVRRLAFTLVAIWAVATILFLMFRLIPGDPSTALLSPELPSEVRQDLLERYGLTQPLYVQYLLYLKNLAMGDLGVSFTQGDSVTSIVFDRMLNTMSLMLTSILLAFLIGPLIGAYLAWHRNERIDTLGMGASLVLRGAPVFWTGMLAIMVFSFQLGWLPTGGMHSPTYTSNSLVDRFVSIDFLYHLAIPLVVVTLYNLSIPIFITRNNMISVLDADYIQLCRAEGLSEFAIIYRHALRNSILPVLHYAASFMAYAFGGSVVIERVFSWPGLGSTMWSAVTVNDYPLAQGAFLTIGVIVIVMNYLADVASVYIDPRAAEESTH